MNIKDKIIFVLVLTIGISILLLVFFSLHNKDYHWIYEFFNNQSVAVILGALSFILGYIVWLNQHTKQLVDRYFEKLVEVNLDILHVDDILIWDIDNRLQKGYLDNVRKKHQLEAKGDSYMMLLEKYNDQRPKKLREITNAYREEYINLTEEKLSDDKNIQFRYSVLRKNVRNKLLELIVESNT